MASIKSVEERKKELLDSSADSLNKDIADIDTITANKKKSTEEKYATQIDLANQEYDEDLRTNEVQKYINMRQVAENNANLGLTDSGLNRTQSTAVQLSASNNASKIERDRTNMVNNLTAEMNRYLTEIENESISSKASVRQAYENAALESANESYNADVEAAAKLEVEEIKAAQELEKEKINAAAKIEAEKIAAQNTAAKEARTALVKLISDFGDNSYSKDQAAKKVKTYIDLYGTDETTLKVLLSNADLSDDDYAEYLSNGEITSAEARERRKQELYDISSGRLPAETTKRQMFLFNLGKNK